MESESQQWRCDFCTFMNESTWLVCGMCLKECKQANANVDQLDSSFFNHFLDEFELNAAPDIAQPAVATVSAAAAVMPVASKRIAEPFTAATAADTDYTDVFPSAQTPDFSNFAASPRTVPGTTAITCTSYAATYPVNAEPVRYAGPFNAVVSKNITPAPIHSSKAVKYNPYNVVPVTANGTFTNGARLPVTRRLVRNATPVTYSSQSANVAAPVTAATSRIRIINPRCNPSYFEPYLAKVTSNATSVPVVNPFADLPSNTEPPARVGVLQPVTSTAASVLIRNPFDDFAPSTGAPTHVGVVQPVASTPASVLIRNPFDDCSSVTAASARFSTVQPNRPTYDAFNAVTAATSLASSYANPVFTSSNNSGAMAQPRRCSDVPFASTSALPDSSFDFNFTSQPSRTETPLTFPTPSTSATINAGTSNLPVAPLSTTSPDSTYNSNLNPANALAAEDELHTLLGFLNDSFASTSNAPIARCVTATPTLNGAARVTTAPFATDSITGWMCTYCTYTNGNLLLRCAICDTTKPENKPITQSVPVVLPGTSHENANSVKDKDAYFECPLCYLLFAQAEGISLQNCGHKFCKNCLRDVINYSAEVKLQCPHKIRGVVCNSLMTAQEVGLILNLEYTGIDARPSQPNISSTTDFIDLCSDEDSQTNSIAGGSGIATGNPPKIGNEFNYQELLELEKEVLIQNIEPFDCTICMTEQQPGEGVMIRDCLHTFCRECLKQAIKCNTDAVMQCPYGDGTTRCDSMLQDREIRALVDADVFEKHLKRSITEAENKTQNAFHCKTVDCVGWCEYEDDVTVFTCPVCSQTNCINCKAIHTGLDCKQYQIRVQLNSADNPDDAKTNKMLQNMLKKGTAMHCPKCAIILSKVTGCDWLCCSMCKTEICWVTRGPRWGPKGRGDYTGGCRCNYGGKRCHPKCGNCH